MKAVRGKSVMGRGSAGGAEAVDLEDGRELGVAFGAGGGLDGPGVATRQAIEAAAAAADHVMVVVPGGEPHAVTARSDCLLLLTVVHGGA